MTPTLERSTLSYQIVVATSICGARRSSTWKASKTRRREMGNCNESGWVDDPNEAFNQCLISGSLGWPISGWFLGSAKVMGAYPNDKGSIPFSPDLCLQDPLDGIVGPLSAVEAGGFEESGAVHQKSWVIFSNKNGYTAYLRCMDVNGFVLGHFLPVWGMFDVGHRLTSRAFFGFFDGFTMI